jgi:hypothetical protein
MDYNECLKNTDNITKTTINEFLERAEKGKMKYGCSLDRTDLIDIDYIQHLKEELMDGVLYLNKFLEMNKNK